MDAILKDKRFARIATDKKFRSAGKKRKKVTIDSRFNSMFKDERFVSKCSVDPRGRPKSYSSKENYTKFYQLKGSDESDTAGDSDSSSEADQHVSNKEVAEVHTDDEDDSDQKDVDDSDSDQDEGEKGGEAVEEEEEDLYFQEGEPISIEPKIKEKLRNDSVDYARGEANLYSDSSSDESSSDDEENTDGFSAWGELDADAGRTEEVTGRLAVCNMDWDRVRAEDIFLVLSSFCPAGGCVKSVDIYISDFGKSRLEEEDRLGPAELRRLEEEREKIEEDYADIVKSGRRAEKAEKAAMERVREYQVNRLKYYYAVAQFDTVQTANSVYTECDGKEYELSATRFDLRFVPEDMEFEASSLTSKCHSLPDPAVYKPKSFLTTALQLGKVELTWDEQDAEREQQLKKAYEKLDDENEDFSFAKNLIASSSSSSEEENDQTTDKNQGSKKKRKKKKKGKKVKKTEDGDKEDGKMVASGSSDQGSDGEDDEDAIAKYRALLLGINKDDDGDEGMEVTWKDEDHSDNEASDHVNEDEDAHKEDMSELTPWEKYLKKKKDKRNKKKQDRKNKMAGSDDDADVGADQVPDGVDLSDPFFAEELGQAAVNKKTSKKKKKKRKHEDSSDVERTGGGGEDGDDGDLALLVMDSDTEKNHFNYRNIVEEEVKGKSKKKWKKKKKKKEEEENMAAKEDNFQVDVNDERFSAIYSRPEFNIDPSQQSFKKTKGMDTLIGEKQKRAAEAASSGHKHRKQQPDNANQPQVKKSRLDPELTASLKSVKNKWEKNAKKSKKKKFK